MLRTIPLNGKNYTLRVNEHDGAYTDGLRATVSAQAGFLFGDTLPVATTPVVAIKWAREKLARL